MSNSFGFSQLKSGLCAPCIRVFNPLGTYLCAPCIRAFNPLGSLACANIQTNVTTNYSN